MATAAELQAKDKIFIGGEWVEPEGSETIEVINSTTEEAMGTIPACVAADADRAVARGTGCLRVLVADVPRGARWIPERDRSRTRRALRGDRGDDRPGARDAADAEQDHPGRPADRPVRGNAAT